LIQFVVYEIIYSFQNEKNIDTMSKISSKSPRSISVVMPGFIEDIDICQIKESQNIFWRNEINLEELSGSIQQTGLLQPVLVRTLDNHYEIVAGNRRFRACKSLG
jgi:ParB family transcriptional regulator, chromosome partitioning protein